MIKKLILAVALALPLSMLAQKFGVVDMETVVTGMPEFTAMQTQLTDTQRQYEEEFGRLQEEVQRLITEYQAIADDANTPQSIKERRIQEIQERDARVNQFRNTATQDLQRLQEQLMTPIQARIQEAINAVGAEGNYTIIFPKEPGLLLYTGADAVDVTPAVRTKLGL